MTRRSRRSKLRCEEAPDPFIQNDLGVPWGSIHEVRSPPGGLKLVRRCDDAGRYVERIVTDVYEPFAETDDGVQWRLVDTSDSDREFNVRAIAEHERKYGKA